MSNSIEDTHDIGCMRFPTPSLCVSPIDISSLLSTAQETSFLPTSIATIDNDVLLDGGFLYGSINSIAGVKGSGKTLISYHLTTSHILLHPLSHVAWIDTTGSFSPVTLHEVILAKLRVDLPHETTARGGDKGNSPVVDGLLDRVQVMRVFDLIGVLEAMEEVKGLCEEDRKGRKVIDETSITSRFPGQEQQEQLTIQKQKRKKTKSKCKRDKAEVYDSTEELSSCSSSNIWEEDKENGIETHGIGEEMASSPITSLNVNTTNPIGLLIINSLTPPLYSHLTEPTFTSLSLVKTHTLSLLSRLSSTLSYLATQFNMCIILINNTESSLPSHLRVHSSNSLNQSSPQTAFSNKRLDGTGIPALNTYLQYCIDLSCLLTRHVRRRKMGKRNRRKRRRLPSSSPSSDEDENMGEISEGEISSGNREDEGEDDIEEDVIVFEVLSDRYGERSGRWGVVGFK